MKIKLDQLVSVEDVYRVAVEVDKVIIDPAVIRTIDKTRKSIEEAIQKKEIIYGVTTGFGAFKNKFIDHKDLGKLQENLILSHAVGVGEYFPDSVVRGIMFLIVNYLSKGYSGVRPIVVETLAEMLNKNVIPLVPEKGSVGSSGDLAPSAHVMLTLIGKGNTRYKGKVMSSKKAMKLAGINTINLQAKEGLALINNTATMSSVASLALVETKKLLKTADIAGALSAEALRATSKAFDHRIHKIKPHEGQIEVAQNLTTLLTGSTMIDNSKTQDQYSLRCMPQIHGAVREAIKYVEKVVTTEINSVTDNPLIFKTDTSIDVISGGNFHGEPVAIAMDTLAIAVSELANISDRRIASILDPATSNGLPAFLAVKGGLNSGMMILQYTTASLASENKVLAHPASVDSIPTSANVEDLVSMGTIAARKAYSIITNVHHTFSIEFLVAAQAIDFRLKDGFHLGEGTKKIYEKIRSRVPFLKKDTIYYNYMASLYKLIDEL